MKYEVMYEFRKGDYESLQDLARYLFIDVKKKDRKNKLYKLYEKSRN